MDIVQGKPLFFVKKMVYNKEQPKGASQMKLGIMGGAFDPIHNAHLHIAQAARRALGLERVLFIPLGDPPHKPSLKAGALDRLAMTRLAVDQFAWAEVSAMEMRRKGRTYSVDTLSELRKSRAQDDLFYIVGADALRDLPQWKDAARAMTMCEVAAVTRGGEDAGALERYALAAKQSVGARVHIIHAPPIEISSTMVRNLCAAGEPVDQLVPAGVAAYIRERRLYQSIPNP